MSAHESLRSEDHPAEGHHDPSRLAAGAQAFTPGRTSPARGSVQPFRIEVVDDETGRGVPLVELRTVNQIRFVTDSNGIVGVRRAGPHGPEGLLSRQEPRL